MKNTPLLLLTLCLVLIFSAKISAQGCVAIRQFSTCAGNGLQTALLPKGMWQVNTSYRYFKSFRHFAGTTENADRVTSGTEVINHANAWDLTLNYGITNRLFGSVTLPFVINARSSLYEHGRNERHTTFSRGMADSRIGLGYWMHDPEKHPLTNLAVGLGVKLPTGNYQSTDIFYNVGPGGSPEVRPVDQSIQPGDGGFGITADFQFFNQWKNGLSFYAMGFYLANPRETNGVRTFRETLSPILQNEAIMSVPDQYSVRAGLGYAFGNSGLSAFAGARYEGVPVHDLIGGSEGFRRPGMVGSGEPGVSYMKDRVTVTASVPIVFYRNRPQSVTDLETQLATGNPRNGDAAFADYLINFSFSVRLGKAADHSMAATN